jgi:hypothetical protein
VFVCYADLPQGFSWRSGIYAFIALFILGGVVSWLARQRDWHRKYIDYRALAEGLRVQRCWRRAGVTTINPSVFAHDHFMQKTDLELGWIRNVMRVPSMERIGDAPVPDWALESVIADWIGEIGVGGQLDYYNRKTDQRARMQRSTSALGQASLWLSFGTVVFLAFFQDLLGSNLTSLLLAIWRFVGILASGARVLRLPQGRQGADQAIPLHARHLHRRAPQDRRRGRQRRQAQDPARAGRGGDGRARRVGADAPPAPAGQHPPVATRTQGRRAGL